MKWHEPGTKFFFLMRHKQNTIYCEIKKLCGAEKSAFFENVLQNHSNLKILYIMMTLLLLLLYQNLILSLLVITETISLSQKFLETHLTCTLQNPFIALFTMHVASTLRYLPLAFSTLHVA